MELSSLIWVGSQIGVVLTLLLVTGALFSGLALIRQTGLTFNEAVQRAAGSGDSVSIDTGLAVLRLFVGLLLMVPGFISDVIALMILIPPIGRWLVRRLTPSVSWNFHSTSQSGPQRGPVIEGEAIEIDGEIGRSGVNTRH